MLHPLINIASVVATFSIVFWIFKTELLVVDSYFFISILVLVSIYTLIAIIRDQETYQKRRWLQDPLKIICKFAFWGGLIWTAQWMYHNHSFYNQTFPHVQALFKFYLQAYLWLGLPYFILAEKLRYSTSNFLNDPYLRLVALIKQVLKGRLYLLRRIYRNRIYRTFFVSSFLRFHFIPIMVNQIYFTHSSVTSALQDNFWEYAVIITTLNSLVWSIDANNGAIGYFWESNFTKTRFRQTDPYPLHWIVTLMCYMPFNIWIATFIPSLMDQTNSGEYLFTEDWFKYSVDSLTLVFLLGYIISGTSLYFSTSNMTYKAIQTRGPYALVRHPATICKLGYFGISLFKFAGAYSLFNVFTFAIWVLVYVGRTWAEERFLSQFQEYRDYKIKTPYRLIPGIY